MRRFFDLLLAGIGIFVSLFICLILFSVTAGDEQGLATVFTVFSLLIISAISWIFLSILAGIRLVFKLDACPFWGRALIISILSFGACLLYAFISASAQAELLSVALAIFSAFTFALFACALAIKTISTKKRSNQENETAKAIKNPRKNGSFKPKKSRGK